MVNCPGALICMIPPQLHMSLQLLLSAGILAMRTVGEPGNQGEEVTGMQGIGVKTPKAAAVAAATIGLEGELHMPKGNIFNIGTWSIMLARGILCITLFLGNSINELGATPNEHDNMAPPVTACPIETPLFHYVSTLVKSPFSIAKS